MCFDHCTYCDPKTTNLTKADTLWVLSFVADKLRCMMGNMHNEPLRQAARIGVLWLIEQKINL